MMTKDSEKLLSIILGYGASFTTIFILTGVNDPVNVTKFIALGVFAFAAIGVAANYTMFRLLSKNLVLTIALVVFVGQLFLSTLSSSSPLSQNFYGVHGRNNGLLTYLFLALILTSSLLLTHLKSFESVIKGLITAGIVNVIYCFWVLTFGDFIGWNNPYGNILGTLGNPNFIGAFLGIFLSVYLAFALKGTDSKLFRFSLFVIVPLTAYEIIESNAIQGRVVGALGVAVVLFFWIRSRYSKKVLAGYSLFSIIVGGFAIAGALQKGPLTEYIYKTSVSLRGQYWISGWNTGEVNPWTGAGMDALGDWYRRSRDSRALDLPGVNTVVNAAHNVPLDMFAFGGWPLFISYLVIHGLAGLAIIKLAIRIKTYDRVFVSLAAAWIGYQTQSIISINQIGLAIWGWVLSGSLIAYEYRTQTVNLTNVGVQTSTKKQKAKKAHSPRVVIQASTGALLGLVIALPPFIADDQWRTAQQLQTVRAIEKSMESSYFNPHNTVKYATNIQGLENSGFKDLARKYAMEAVAWNPESFTLWQLVYFISGTTEEEKAMAASNLKRLDPLNPEVTALK